MIPLLSKGAQELGDTKSANATHSPLVFPIGVTPAARRMDFERVGIVLETGGSHADIYSQRHTFGTRFAEAGAQVGKIMKLIRHGHIELPLEYCFRLDPESIDEPIRLQTELGDLPTIGGPLAS